MKFSINTLKIWLGKKIHENIIIKKLNFLGFESTSENNIINTTIPYNRPNCNNLFSIINELSSLVNLSYFKRKCIKLKKKISTKNIHIKIDNSFFCPIYYSVIINNFNNKIKTKKHILKLLKDNNIQSHNYIVDLTNYILLITGQPLHAYDLNKIKSHIIIKKINKTQEFKTINNHDITVIKNTPIITDSTNKILALPGIIGSSYTKVNKKTTNILIECAIFEKKIIKKITNRYNIKTHASDIFANGINLKTTNIALNYLLKILTKNKETKLTVHLNKNTKKKFKAPIIKLTKQYANKIIDKKITTNTINNCLTKRLFNFKEHLYFWYIKIPYNRSDIYIKESIISEILKCYGYKKIYSKQLKITKPIKYNTTPITQIKNYLINSNFNETINYSFVDYNIESLLFNKEFLKIKNPMSEKLNTMRSSLLQGLLKNITTNTNRDNNDLKLFEIGHVWTNQMEENLNLGVISTNNFLFDNLYRSEQAFYVLKGLVENICTKLLDTDNLIFKKNTTYNNALNQKISAEIFINDINVGLIGALNKSHLKLLTNNQNIYFVELFLNKISKKTLTKKFEQFSKFPKIKKDISFTLDEYISYQNIFEYLINLKINNLQTIYLIDVYNIQKEKKKTLTFRFIFQSINSTLKDDNINTTIYIIYKEITQKFNATIKGFNDSPND